MFNLDADCVNTMPQAYFQCYSPHILKSIVSIFLMVQRRNSDKFSELS